MKSATNIDSTKTVVLSAIAGNSVITVAKAIGWMLTASPSLLAETIHSFADTTNQILLWVGIRHGQQEASPKYPFGKGRARYLWNLISAMGIFFIGFGVTTYHGIHSLLSADKVPDWNIWIVGILLFALIVEGAVFIQAYKVVMKEKGNVSLWQHIFQSDDPTSVAILLEDGVAVFGVILAIAGFWLSQALQSPLPDAIASILIGFLLGFMALILAYSNGRLLLGVSAPSSEEDAIRQFLEKQDVVEKVVDIKTAVVGPDRFRLSVEVEIHGSLLIDKETLKREADLIRKGDKDPLPVLVDSSARMVRIIGNKINSLEQMLYKRFPDIVAIDLEIN